jgi:sortase A
MKKHLSTIILILIFFIGLSLLLYPTFADWWNSVHQSRAVASYVEQVANMDGEKYDELWSAAWEYNRSLINRPNGYLLSEEQKARYD